MQTDEWRRRQCDRFRNVLWAAVVRACARCASRAIGTSHATTWDGLPRALWPGCCPHFASWHGRRPGTPETPHARSMRCRHHSRPGPRRGRVPLALQGSVTRLRAARWWSSDPCGYALDCGNRYIRLHFKWDGERGCISESHPSTETFEGGKENRCKEWQGVRGADICWQTPTGSSSHKKKVRRHQSPRISE